MAVPPTAPPPKLVEADVFFELFLPTLLESKAATLEVFKGRIDLLLVAAPGGDPVRTWCVRGGARPWLQRGVPATGRADAVIQLSESLVNAVVQGREPDLEEAVAKGELAIVGDPKVLARLGLTMHDAERVLDTLLKR